MPSAPIADHAVVDSVNVWELHQTRQPVPCGHGGTQQRHDHLSLHEVSHSRCHGIVAIETRFFYDRDIRGLSATALWKKTKKPVSVKGYHHGFGTWST